MFFDNVPELKIEEFNGKDLKKPFTGYLIIYAPWCGFCQKLQPIINKLSDKVGIVSVNGDAEKEINQIIPFKGFPSIHFYKEGQYDGEYNADRTYDALLNYFNRNSIVVPHPIMPVKPQRNYLHLLLKLLFILAFLYVLYVIYKKYANKE